MHVTGRSSGTTVPDRGYESHMRSDSRVLTSATTAAGRGYGARMRSVGRVLLRYSQSSVTTVADRGYEAHMQSVDRALLRRPRLVTIRPCDRLSTRYYGSRPRARSTHATGGPSLTAAAGRGYEAIMRSVGRALLWQPAAVRCTHAIGRTSATRAADRGYEARMRPVGRALLR
jgi:hypothetical protein